MSEKKVIVKNIDAIQDFGSMNILCTDKTGTLTQDKIVLQRHLDPYGKESLDVLKYEGAMRDRFIRELLDREFKLAWGNETRI